MATDLKGKTITIRAIGRDFTGPADSLETWDRAKAFAQGYMWALAGTDREVKEVKLFHVDPSGVCLPCELSRVIWDEGGFK